MLHKFNNFLKLVSSRNYFHGFYATAIEAYIQQDSGYIVFFNDKGVYQNQLTVGALPEMITMTPDSSK